MQVVPMNKTRLAFFAGKRLLTNSPTYSTTHPKLPRRHSSAIQAVLEDVVTTRDERITEDTETPSILPADADRQRFTLHWSVDMWRDFNARTWARDLQDESSPLPDRLRSFVDTLTKAVSTSAVFESTQAAQYWAYHVTRSGYFATQAILGITAARAAAGNNINSDGPLSKLESISQLGWSGPLAEAFLSYYQDYENIKEGKYVLPWDMDITHRQFNPLYILSKGRKFVNEAVETLQRRERGQADDVWLQSPFLPNYFQSGFHYQTDGWLSSRSSSVYEVSTETLFVGRQDAMQRSTLLPIASFVEGKDSSQMTALEIGCGTGRFGTFLKDNYPTMDLTLTDLSPFYLAEARSNMKYWKRKRAPGLALSGVDGNGTTFVQTKAEELTLPSERYDIVYSVYLFHELPEDIRRKAVQEMARVVKPGGLVVLTDSVQLGDRSSLDATLGQFGDFNEAYYRNYIKTDLGALFEEAGLMCDSKVVSSSTKTLSFRKPGVDDDAKVAEIVEDKEVDVVV